MSAALVPVGQAVDQAVAETTQVFGKISSKEEELCPMCQENVGASKYGIFAYSHMIHQDCRSAWENHERV